MHKVRLAVVQMRMHPDPEHNTEHAETAVREAAGNGADVVLLPELFAHPYFCKDQDTRFFDWAMPAAGHPLIERFSDLAKELKLVLPISFFERSGPAYFNSLAMLDNDGSVRGIYRKAHIPDGPGYQEKFYFTPGNVPFVPYATAIGKVCGLICWDQWFPEPARLLALRGAEMILYPTAIGSEPPSPEFDSSAHWRRVMQGHAAANIVPVAAANRVGEEIGRESTVTFYGSSFITDATGEIVASAGRDEETILYADIDLDAAASLRREWGIFRDRRPDLYLGIAGFDGSDV